VQIATDVTLVAALAGVWLAAGLLAETLPTARTALELRRRAALLSTVILVGTAVFVAIPLVDWVLPGTSAAPAAALLPAVPALFAVTVTVRRLTRVRQGSAVFGAAPHTPLPPGLRAAAAHPLLTTPLQVTGLAALAGLPVATGVISVPGGEVAGIAIAVVGLAGLLIGVRAAVRHSRLRSQVLTPVRSSRRMPVKTG
jgi:hypothetical protein